MHTMNKCFRVCWKTQIKQLPQLLILLASKCQFLLYICFHLRHKLLSFSLVFDIALVPVRWQFWHIIVQYQCTETLHVQFEIAWQKWLFCFISKHQHNMIHVFKLERVAFYERKHHLFGHCLMCVDICRRQHLSTCFALRVSMKS